MVKASKSYIRGFGGEEFVKLKNYQITLVDRLSSAHLVGGDTIQIQALNRFLQENNYETNITNNVNENTTNTDLFILFNLTNAQELFYHFDHIKVSGIPYIIFPIYWDLDSVIPLNAYIGPRRYIKKIFPESSLHILRNIIFYIHNRKLLKLQINNLLAWNKYAKKVKEILNNSCFICVNSHSEAEHLVKKFPLSQEAEKRIKVIRNGIDKSELKMPLSIDELRGQNFLCCIGGIGPRKNQIMLVRAANELKINLVLVGNSSKDNMSYYNKLKKEAGPTIKFLGHLSHSEAKGIMAASKGLLQPSYIETPGLAAMEAYSLGVPIAVSDTGPVREYFGDTALYCDPSDIDSIKAVMTRLLSQDIAQRLNVEFIEKYQWSSVFSPLLEPINSIVSKPKSIY
ncbi:MAG TPA: glycosyltransferase [Paenibacillus sp.]|uniref:glycosyltransferase n=1 Tax=Paenibacillus sp. TaxID=58172 RepID=UPI002C00DBA8|nr:glycosyltransferase [Paenibacillus sp.]HUC93011.1 glycosyltransferase [Paenibacillus sp.]